MSRLANNTNTRLGAVSFLNARPLIYGLDATPGIEVIRAVPSRLAGLLNAGDVDVALLPVVDAVAKDRRRTIISNACIGCDGATLTVRVFSRRDPGDIKTLHVDGDSHTSVALAMLLWLEKYHRRLTIVQLPAGDGPDRRIPDDCEAVLLIGDKVIAPPIALSVFSTQLDLGATWRALTGLPFVFAVWTIDSERNIDIDVMSDILDRARDTGVARIGEIAANEAPALNWPTDLASRYLGEFLRFRLDDRARDGMRQFIEMARGHGVLDAAEEAVSV